MYVLHSFSKSFLGLWKQKYEEPWVRLIIGGKDDEENRVSYLFFSLVKIPEETRGLDIFKPLSHILTKKDSYRTCLWHPNMHTLSF